MKLLLLLSLVLFSTSAALHAQGLVKVTAGEFEAQVPGAWAKAVQVVKVPIQPLYSAEDWKAFKADPMNSLKPSYDCRPQHWAIRFPALHLGSEPFDAAKAGDNASAPQILIHKADEWEAASQNGHVEADSAAKFIHKLREQMETWDAQDPTHGDPAFMDAELRFATGRKRIDFKGGHGFRLLAQWNQEADFVRQGRLHYLFLGLSDDNTCQIIATIPVDLPGLPKDESKADHLGHSIQAYEKFAAQFDAYEGDVKQWLDNSAAKITPSLEKLDAMMSSLKVETWK